MFRVAVALLGCVVLAGLVSSANIEVSGIRCNETHCNCTSVKGKDIGYSTPIEQSTTKNCRCATAKYAYMQRGLIGLFFNCDALGNYAPVQCRGSVCYCVDAFGKKVNEETVSIGEIDSLNC